jgi:hypothetical protein
MAMTSSLSSFQSREELNSRININNTLASTLISFRKNNIVKTVSYLLVLMMIFIIPLGCDSDNGSDHDDGNAKSFRFGMHFDASGTEDFIAKTSDPELIDIIAAELENPPYQRFLHIHGRIERGNDGYNLNWSWHFVSGEWDLAEMSIEVCDGTPSYVEENLDEWLSMQDSFCPWDSYVKEEVVNE